LRLAALWPAREAIQILVGAGLLNQKGIALRDQDPFDKHPYTPYALTITMGAGRLADPPRCSKPNRRPAKSM